MVHSRSCGNTSVGQYEIRFLHGHSCTLVCISTAVEVMACGRHFVDQTCTRQMELAKERKTESFTLFYTHFGYKGTKRKNDANKPKHYLGLGYHHAYFWRFLFDPSTAHYLCCVYSKYQWKGTNAAPLSWCSPHWTTPLEEFHLGGGIIGDHASIRCTTVCSTAEKQRIYFSTKGGLKTMASCIVRDKRLIRSIRDLSY